MTLELPQTTNPDFLFHFQSTFLFFELNQLQLMNKTDCFSNN